MTNYTVRVELHDADGDDYESLHKKMKAEGFSKRIKTDAGTFELPTAEYSMVSELTPSEILSKAEAAANRVKPRPKPSILVTGQETPRIFSGLKQAE